jgi:hypothetical protein
MATTNQYVRASKIGMIYDDISNWFYFSFGEGRDIISHYSPEAAKKTIDEKRNSDRISDRKIVKLCRKRLEGKLLN